MPGVAAFAPNNGYLFFCGEGKDCRYWAAGLPKSLQDLFDRKQLTAEILNAAFGPDGGFCISFQASDGTVAIAHEELPLELENWLFTAEGPHRPERDVVSLRVTLGPNKSFFAYDNNGQRYHGLPTELEAKVQSCLGSSKKSKAGSPLRHVSLGAESTFVFLFDRGAIQSISADAAPALKSFRKHPQSPTLTSVVLSPYSTSHYIVMTTSGACTGVVSENAREAFAAFSLHWLLSHPAVSTSTMSQKVANLQASHDQIVEELKSQHAAKISSMSTNHTRAATTQHYSPVSSNAMDNRNSYNSNGTKPSMNTSAELLAAANMKPKKSSGEKFAANLRIANGVLGLITGMENLANVH